MHDLLERFNVVKSDHPDPDEFRYEFLQVLSSDELREKEFSEEAFTWPPSIPNPPVDAEEFVSRAMGLIKVRLGVRCNCGMMCNLGH